MKPPMSDNIAPERICSRALTWPQKQGDPTCPNAPFLHVAWDVDDDGVEAGFVCEEHAREMTRKNWTVLQSHEVGPDCGMPGSRWFFDENVCRCPDEMQASEQVIAVGEACA